MLVIDVLNEMTRDLRAPNIHKGNLKTVEQLTKNTIPINIDASVVLIIKIIRIIAL